MKISLIDAEVKPFKEFVAMIDKNRLGETFAQMVKIDSISREEAEISHEIRKILESLGAEIFIDDSGRQTGSNTGNLIAKFEGTRNVPVMMLNAHMDTVEPGRGVKPELIDGIFRSDGTTVLGTDDKSAIAIIIEVLRNIHEKGLPHGPLEVVFTTCEEIGLLGAKYLDYSLISSRFGYALDTSDIDTIITMAPAANRFDLVVHGKSAHAGAEPEKGINAIQLAGQALAGLELGRIDAETTCNIGFIECPGATNIVPERVRVKGEVRSHNVEKLNEVTETMIGAFRSTVDNFPGRNDEDGLPKLSVELENEFPRTFIPEDHPVVRLAKNAAQKLGREIVSRKTGGGADANIFFSKDIVTGVIGTGMKDVHTVREWIRVDDMAETGRLLAEIIRMHAETGNAQQ